MSKPILHLGTTNWSSYSCSLKQRGPLMVWFEPEMSWFAVPSGKLGPLRGSRRLPYSFAFRVLLGLPLRQITGFFESLLGLDRCQITPRFSAGKST